LAQSGQELGSVSESVRVPEEVCVQTVGDQPVGIQMQYVAGDLLAAHAFCDLEHLGGGMVAATSHPVAEGPQGRQRAAPGQQGVALQTAGYIAAEHQVEIDRVV